MIYITGDTHRDFERLYNNTFNKDDMVIILGDAGINYYLDERDRKLKENLNKLNIKLFCIQGNHEERPENIATYKEIDMFSGKVFIEDDFPNLIFAKNGETYNIDGYKVLVIGGAYSIDKNFRLMYGYEWFKNEQLSEEEKEAILNKYTHQHFDIILSHTCPKKYEPTEVFMKGIDQSKVDKSMENFLDKVEENINYEKWYCGHFHTEKKVDKIEFMFGRIKVFNKDEYYPKYDKNGYEIIRDYCMQDEVMAKDDICCPVCRSNNILIQKGDGFKINGPDFIALICHNCQKVYGFSDVKYYPNCPKEL